MFSRCAPFDIHILVLTQHYVDTYDYIYFITLVFYKQNNA